MNDSTRVAGRHDPRRMLAVVEASPAAVAAKDKARWLGLFARFCMIEDPVGSRAHICGVYDKRSANRGQGPLSRFYDTFIAPNDIVFHVERDIVCDQFVLRDLSIEITMGLRVRVDVPVHLLYQLHRYGGEYQILRLAAHWELLPMVRQALGFGRYSFAAIAALGWRMLRIQGLVGVAGFCRALAGVGSRGKARVREFVSAYNKADGHALRALFAGGPPAIEWPAPTICRDIDHFLALRTGPLRLDTLLASGHTVSASCRLGPAGEQRRGIILWEFSNRLALDRVSAYWE